MSGKSMSLLHEARWRRIIAVHVCFVYHPLLWRTNSKFPLTARTSKSRGYGFVSFKDAKDFVKAMKEMNGRFSVLYSLLCVSD